VGPALSDLTWRIALYAVLSLTVVRMLPVAISLVGSRSPLPTVGFLGWFGPRGLASIIFALILLEEGGLPHDGLILAAAFVTVGLSVLAHGVTAAPLANAYADWSEANPELERSPALEGSRVSEA
jgi:NhaP-type Na+/H+ or K+/H+ antiporter